MNLCDGARFSCVACVTQFTLANFLPIIEKVLTVKCTTRRLREIGEWVFGLNFLQFHCRLAIPISISIANSTNEFIYPRPHPRTEFPFSSTKITASHNFVVQTTVAIKHSMHKLHSTYTPSLNTVWRSATQAVCAVEARDVHNQVAVAGLLHTECMVLKNCTISLMNRHFAPVCSRITRLSRKCSEKVTVSTSQC